MNVGSQIGQYRIVRKIGAGGMGTVFVGEHILLKRQAAIKTLLPTLSTQSDVVERFFREARAASAVADPGVVQIYDFGYHVDGTAYIVMELLHGEALSERLRRLGTLPVEEALRVARQIAGALAMVHEADIVHRDLKPENIFLVRDGEARGGERAKLLDFGICKLGNESIVADTNTAVGTPMYMSPEQCAGIDVDGRSDLYGLGCVLFQMLTGHVPFERDHRQEIMEAHVEEPAPHPTERVPALPVMVDEIVDHCLAKSPDERFQTMAALQHAIDQILPQLTPAPLVEAPAVHPLGPGFKTDFDGNHRTALHELLNTWYVASTPEPDTLRAATGELAIPRQPTGHRSLLAIMLGGVAVAIAGTVLALMASDDNRAAVAVGQTAKQTDDPLPMPPPMRPTPPTDPFPQPDPDDPPPPPPDPDPEPDEPDGPDESAIVFAQPPIIEPPAPAIVHEAVVARADLSPPVQPVKVQRRVIKRGPIRYYPRPIVRAAPPPKPPAEDLYDTR